MLRDKPERRLHSKLSAESSWAVANYVVICIFAVFLLRIDPASAATVTVTIGPGASANTFNPQRALGAAVDGQSAAVFDNMWSEGNVNWMLKAGWGPVSYRLYTELSVQQWHWNPSGRFEGGVGEGYWVSNTESKFPIRITFGYRLPHRGFTVDQGNSDDYSRLTDGDLKSYWKSNPYLGQPFVGEDERLHPQWIVVDLGSERMVDAVRLWWANPFATSYRVQYWTGKDAISNPAHGDWQTFPNGTVPSGDGGTVTLRLAQSPLGARFIRVLMTSSSHTYDTHGTGDIRNSIGYAMFEVGVGTLVGKDFNDLVTHSRGRQQTQTFVSSVDPWHAPGDRVTNEEQPGLDFILGGQISRGLPAMVPVSMLYGVPEDSAAEIAYLEKKGYKIAGVELGEEPDGQYMLPEDYGALYCQWADALHKVDPCLSLGGPVFQGVNPASPTADMDVGVWPDQSGNTSYLKRFLAYLRSHGHLGDLSFFSFETYPFGWDTDTWQPLFDTPCTVLNQLNTWRADGIGANVPMIDTEYNASSNTPQAIMDIRGMLWHADFLGSLLSDGAAGSFYYEYEPTILSSQPGLSSFGALGMFVADRNDQILQPTAQFFSTQMLTQVWCEPIDAMHVVYPSSTDFRDEAGNVLVTAYTVLRPDGKYAVMLINKDQTNAYQAPIAFHNLRTGSNHFFAGPVSITTIGSDQYVWHPNGAYGWADPDGPPVETETTAKPDTRYSLPRASITVVCGTVK